MGVFSVMVHQFFGFPHEYELLLLVDYEARWVPQSIWPLQIKEIKHLPLSELETRFVAFRVRGLVTILMKSLLYYVTM